MSAAPGTVEHGFENTGAGPSPEGKRGKSREVHTVNKAELGLIGDAELVEELSMLTTQAARMRARMADIMAELERRRCARPTQSHARR
ncbi:hypothetical protein GCM10010187_15700 [Actinomadura coerulea]|nr:hypothetical protein GCM10010187_15700 [Actinomadura coerulea]